MPGAPVADGARGVDRDRPDPASQLVAHGRRGRLLHELLMPALDRAVALAQVDDGTMGVGEHLHLDVPRVLEEPLDVDGRVGEVRLALPPGRRKSPLRLPGRPDDLEALPASAGSRLDRQRPAVFLAEREHRVHGLDRLGRAGDDRHARLLHEPPRLHLRAHGLDRVGRGADPDEPGPRDGPCEGGVLGQEAVAGVNRVRPRPLRRVEDPLLVEVALGRRAGPEEEGLVGLRDVERAPVGLRVHGDGTDPELAQRAEDADGDLATVGDEDFAEDGHDRRILPL